MTAPLVMYITLDLIRERLARRAPSRVNVERGFEAAVALLLAPAAAGGLELLLIKRATQPHDPWSGQIALPGGRREQRDRDLLVTAMRETREEVGISVEPDRLLGELDDLHPRTVTLPPVVVRPFVFGLMVQPGVTPSAEVALHMWVSLERLASGDMRTEITIPGRGAPFPAYRVGADVLWGMTERIIAQLLVLLH